MSSHVFSAQDNTDKLTIRAYKAFGFALGVFIDDVEFAGYGEAGSRMVALDIHEAKNLRDLLDSAIIKHEGGGN